MSLRLSLVNANFHCKSKMAIFCVFIESFVETILIILHPHTNGLNTVIFQIPCVNCSIVFVGAWQAYQPFQKLIYFVQDLKKCSGVS